MAKKYYGVRNGRTPGIYDNWADCKAQIDKYPNAIFKSFPTEKEAQDYFNTATVQRKNESEQGQESSIDVFVDGSYFQGRYSWAFAVYQNGTLLFSNSGVGDDTEAAKMNNVAGEIAAAVKAMEWAEANNVKPITIHHDYSGIMAWADGSWKAKNRFTEAYAQFASERLSWLTFSKVAGHTGVEGNELVDRLAGEALGIK
ncbi:MAG: ribonuclease H family protein [Anaerolineaceae bacterium]|nr:ribonuclease H family protein [Anaerolineaceae bacterium]